MDIKVVGKKYFIVSDVHGFYDELMAALNEAGFDINNPEHIFVNLGDLLDRGEKPLKCLQFVNNLSDDRKILIKGNHEDLLEEAIVRREFRMHDYHNKTVETAIDLSDVFFMDNKEDITDELILSRVKKNAEWKKYSKSVVDYFEDDHCIFTHGWIPCRIINPEVYEYEDVWRNGKWHTARWLNGMSAWSQGVNVEGKTIFCGHWHTSWGHCRLHKDGPEWNNSVRGNINAKFTPFIDEGIVALDACTAVNHFVNCVIVDADTGNIMNK